ncbi:hypothetical protein SacN8_08160 [Sulfolobus acidocaldarius N8]|uniref:Uncharacterized protein n=2 Tax=Sulfolobus acidocaldarius TaxID=2285 RepID=M1JDT8_9CREN|nr:hypothetical protein SacN8_08160 [Sulfolobus acidocaldarius N8]AGE73865.1 hypothetical protein SacRon12I_08170 [Sulfolobus acidocaldarius Ron12/I]WCM35495.1 hypothetical protein GO597_09230 [Sulfolobus acidocaldarius DSM 639]
MMLTPVTFSADIIIGGSKEDTAEFPNPDTPSIKEDKRVPKLDSPSIVLESNVINGKTRPVGRSFIIGIAILLSNVPFIYPVKNVKPGCTFPDK